MRITVSGLPGSGTTSLSRYLAERHGFTMISAGRSSASWQKSTTWNLPRSAVLRKKTRPLTR